jgi:hypothetical protein
LDLPLEPETRVATFAVDPIPRGEDFSHRGAVKAGHPRSPGSSHVAARGGEPRSLESLDALRERTLARLKEAHLATILDMVFTHDRRWGAPESPGGDS